MGEDLVKEFKMYIEEKTNTEIDNRLFVPFQYADYLNSFIEKHFEKKVHLTYGNFWNNDIVSKIISENVEGVNTPEEIDDYILFLDGMVIKNDDDFNVYIVNQNGQKDYVVLMHEIAHICLNHFDEFDRNVYFNFRSPIFNNTDTLNQERDADEFALNFSLPTETLDYINKTKDFSVQGKADLFQVRSSQVINRER